MTLSVLGTTGPDPLRGGPLQHVDLLSMEAALTERWCGRRDKPPPPGRMTCVPSDEATALSWQQSLAGQQVARRPREAARKEGVTDPKKKEFREIRSCAPNRSMAGAICRIFHILVTALKKVTRN